LLISEFPGAGFWFAVSGHFAFIRSAPASLSATLAVRQLPDRSTHSFHSAIRNSPPCRQPYRLRFGALLSCQPYLPGRPGPEISLL